jgi:ABC-type transport system substrate-binding protein
VLLKTRTPLYGLVPKGLPGYYSGTGTPRLDGTKARAELARCPGGIDVPLVYPRNAAENDAMAAAIRDMMAAVSITLTPTPVSTEQWLDIVSQPLPSSNVKLVLNTWYMDYPDPQDYCDVLLRSDSPVNIGGFRSGTYDSLLAKGDTAQSAGARAVYYQRAQVYALQQAAEIAIDSRMSFALTAPSVHGLVGGMYRDLWASGGDWSRVSVSG